MPEHVLITGGAGFIGTRLARRFAAAGHTVTVLDALIPQVHGEDPQTTSPLLRSLDGVATVIEGTVTSSDDLRGRTHGSHDHRPPRRGDRHRAVDVRDRPLRRRQRRRDREAPRPARQRAARRGAAL